MKKSLFNKGLKASFKNNTRISARDFSVPNSTDHTVVTQIIGKSAVAEYLCGMLVIKRSRREDLVGLRRVGLSMIWVRLRAKHWALKGQQLY